MALKDGINGFAGSGEEVGCFETGELVYTRMAKALRVSLSTSQVLAFGEWFRMLYYGLSKIQTG
jgi:hypothetical protein